jgi:hypothetical protein
MLLSTKQTNILLLPRFLAVHICILRSDPLLRYSLMCPAGHCQKFGEHIVQRNRPPCRWPQSQETQARSKGDKRYYQGACFCTLSRSANNRCLLGMGRHAKNTCNSNWTRLSVLVENTIRVAHSKLAFSCIGQICDKSSRIGHHIFVCTNRVVAWIPSPTIRLACPTPQSVTLAFKRSSLAASWGPFQCNALQKSGVHMPLVNVFLLLHPQNDVTHVLPKAPAYITPRRESSFSQFTAFLNTSRTTYKIRDVVHDAHIAKQIFVSDSNHEAITATSSIRVIACNDATTLRAFASDVKILKSSSPTYAKKQIVVSGNAQVDLFSRFTSRYRDFANARVTSKDALGDVFSELRFSVPELPDHIGRMDSLRDQIPGPPTFPFSDATIKKHFLQALAPEAVPLLTRILISGVRTTNVSDPALQEALLEIDPEFNLLHIINNSLQEAPFNILLTAATFTNPSLTQTFLTKCLTRAKAEDNDDPNRTHFYPDPCGLSGSLNHIPAYVSFKIDACNRASNGGAFEPFHSKVSLPCLSNPLSDQVLNANHDSHKTHSMLTSISLSSACSLPCSSLLQLVLIPFIRFRHPI